VLGARTVREALEMALVGSDERGRGEEVE
jgi:hypothetical protein